MPELPEVERVRLDLLTTIGARVTRTKLNRRDVVRDPHGRRRGKIIQSDLLERDTIADLDRRGKQLAIVGASGRLVLVHLGMSGQLRLLAPGEPIPNPHAHAIWTLGSGARLVFRDPRRFGGLWLLPDRSALNARWEALGPDAIRIRAADLGRSLARSRRAVKASLLDQGVLAGVGNIYADESLFGARIAPLQASDALTPDEVSRLASCIRRVLSKAVEAGGSTLRDYVRPDGSAGRAGVRHKVYGRGGQPCTRCKSPLASCLVAQRSTVWCPSCQSSN